MKTKPFPKTLIVFCKFSVLRQQHQWIVFSRECTAVEIQRNTRPTLHILKTWGTETVLKRPKKCKYRWERTCKLTCKFTLIREQSGTGPTTTVTLFSLGSSVSKNDFDSRKHERSENHCAWKNHSQTQMHERGKMRTVTIPLHQAHTRLPCPTRQTLLGLGRAESTVNT